MAYRLVTCPDTAHLELIEFDESPCGMLILGCSTFRPPCEIDCPRTCAARLDQRRRTRGGEGEIDENVLKVGDALSLDVLGRWQATSS
jgi:hypothetical protein